MEGYTLGTKTTPAELEKKAKEMCDDELCIYHGTGTRDCLFDGKYVSGVEI